MENQESNQNRIEPKINVSRDGKWIIIRVPDIEQPIIKPVAYFEKILEHARKRALQNVESVKG
jgi:hypothetical protein